jgi:hypothetical protein
LYTKSDAAFIDESNSMSHPRASLYNREPKIMKHKTTQEDATLLDVLIDGFEKNEIFDGFHWRDLPMPDDEAAARKFASLLEEARHWKGQPSRMQDGPVRRLAAWPDLEIRQAGRGVRVFARAPWFDTWWHDKRTWSGDPMGPIRDWLKEDRGSK